MESLRAIRAGPGPSRAARTDGERQLDPGDRFVGDPERRRGGDGVEPVGRVVDVLVPLPEGHGGLEHGVPHPEEEQEIGQRFLVAKPPGERGPRGRELVAGPVDQAGEVGEGPAVEVVVGVAHPLDRVFIRFEVRRRGDRQGQADQALEGGDRHRFGRRIPGGLARAERLGEGFERRVDPVAEQGQALVALVQGPEARRPQVRRKGRDRLGELGPGLALAAEPAASFRGRAEIHPASPGGRKSVAGHDLVILGEQQPPDGREPVGLVRAVEPSSALPPPVGGPANLFVGRSHPGRFSSGPAFS